jgi:hypothetical protein
MLQKLKEMDNIENNSHIKIVFKIIIIQKILGGGGVFPFSGIVDFTSFRYL